MRLTVLLASFPFAFAVIDQQAVAQQPDPPDAKAPPPLNSGKLDLELLLDWENVSEPRLSPDGGQIVFTRQWTDKIEDKLRSELWIMQADGKDQRFLAEGSGAEWSLDGSRIAFLADGAPKGTQIWVMRMATRERTQITHATESPGSLRWSPDGTQIACTIVVPEKDGFPIELPKAPKGSKWIDDAKVITRLTYRRDQQGYRPSGWRHVFVVDSQGGTPRQLTSGDYDHGAPVWAGGEILTSGLRQEDADWQEDESELYAVDVESGNVRQLTTRRGPDSGPVVCGDHIAWLGYDYTGHTHDITRVYAMPRAGGPPRCLSSDFDRSPQNLVASRDGRSVFFQYEDQGSIRVGRVQLDGKRDVLSGTEMQFRLADVAPDGSVLGVFTSVHEPGAIARRGPDGKLQKLTAVHDDLLHGRKLGEVEELWWNGPDEFGIQGWLVKPPDFDAKKKYPLILQIHGGPHAMFGVNFDFERQNHAANGYLLLYCNPRGSTGYGDKFACGIQNAYPGKDYDDLMAGVDAVIARGFVDTDNLFVYGGSGGGVLTCWIVGSTNRFRAAVSMFPVTNWISFVGTTDGPYWYHNFKQLPWDDVTEHWQRSPLRLVGNVKTPTMLLTGELDLRTPMGQTEEYYQALKLRKVDTVLVRVQDEYHGASSRHVSNRLRRILYVRTWFEKHKAGAGKGTTETSAPK